MSGMEWDRGLSVMHSVTYVTVMHSMTYVWLRQELEQLGQLFYIDETCE
jgi:hypothetical protein